jgi:ribosomal protein S27AE/DNA-directed RNA polymerase subunit RPC12/RpoP
MTSSLAELYNDLSVQLVLMGFLENKITILTPVVDVDKTPRYVIVENVTRLATDEVTDLLEKMTQASLLKKELFTKIVSCPKCSKASEVYDRFECPKCGLVNMSVLTIPKSSKVTGSTRHNEQREFAEPRGSHAAGSMYQCDNCGEIFVEPSLQFDCKSCRFKFRFRDAKLRDVFSYRLNEEASHELRASAYLLTIKDMFEKRGFKTQVPSVLTGESGASHRFTLGGKKNSSTIVIDLVQGRQGSEIGETEVLAFNGKLIDVQPTDSVFVAIPRLGPDGEKLAKASRVKYVEAVDLKEAAASLEEFIASSQWRLRR